MDTRRVSRWITLAVAVSAGLAGSASAAVSAEPEPRQSREPFSIVMIPDTQTASSEHFHAQADWIVEHLEDRNIRFVAHVGDIQEWPSSSASFDISRTAMAKLDDKVPYALALGNHDFDAWACEPAGSCDPWDHIDDDRTADLFNENFPRAKYAGWPSFGGTHPDDINDNSFHMFTAGGTDWLMLTVKFAPTEEELNWAEQVIADHPDRQVILSTHDYLMSDGQRSDVGNQIWQRIKAYPNVAFTLSGHWRGATAARRVDAGDNGNQVHQIFADYSTYEDDHEDSYFRVMEFDPAAKTVSVETYSPYCAANPDAGCPASKTGDPHEFVLNDIAFPPTDGTAHELVRQSSMTATASSEQPDLGAAGNALDGDSRTGWHTPYDSSGVPTVELPQSVTLDLGQEYDTVGLRYGPRQDGSTNGIVTGYNVYVSTDGSAYTKVADGDWAFDVRPKRADWPAVTARYVRFEATATGSEYDWASAAELNVAAVPE